jgi:hypothetical protein
VTTWRSLTPQKALLAPGIKSLRVALPERYADYARNRRLGATSRFRTGPLSPWPAIETSARVIALCGVQRCQTPAVAVRIGRSSMPAGSTRFARAQTHS